MEDAFETAILEPLYFTAPSAATPFGLQEGLFSSRTKYQPS